jgi:hypothetical protein
VSSELHESLRAELAVRIGGVESNRRRKALHLVLRRLVRQRKSRCTPSWLVPEALEVIKHTRPDLVFTRRCSFDCCPEEDRKPHVLVGAIEVEISHHLPMPMLDRYVDLWGWFDEELHDLKIDFGLFLVDRFGVIRAVRLDRVPSKPKSVVPYVSPALSLDYVPPDRQLRLFEGDLTSPSVKPVKRQKRMWAFQRLVLQRHW